MQKGAENGNFNKNKNHQKNRWFILGIFFSMDYTGKLPVFQCFYTGLAGALHIAFSGHWSHFGRNARHVYRPCKTIT